MVAANRLAAVRTAMTCMTVATWLHWAAVDRLALAESTQAVGPVVNAIGRLLADVRGRPHRRRLEERDQNATEEAA